LLQLHKVLICLPVVSSHQVHGHVRIRGGCRLL